MRGELYPNECEPVGWEELPEGMQQFILEMHGPPEGHAAIGLVFFRNIGTGEFVSVLPERKPN